jgi:hypothetical protein
LNIGGLATELAMTMTRTETDLKDGCRDKREDWKLSNAREIAKYIQRRQLQTLRRDGRGTRRFAGPLLLQMEHGV